MFQSSLTIEEMNGKRDNFYAVLEEKTGNLGKNCIYQRIVIISRISDPSNDASEIGVKYEEFIDKTARKMQIEGPTGLLMLQKKHAVHVIEAPMRFILLYMREVLKDTQTPGSNFDISKILVLSHDISLLYQIFNWQKMEIEVVDTDFKPGVNDEKLVVDILRQLNDIGSYIMEIPKQNAKSECASLFIKNSQLVPSLAVVDYLLNEDVDCILTVEEMLEKYDSVYDTPDPSNYTWPLPRRKYPYNYLF